MAPKTVSNGSVTSKEKKKEEARKQPEPIFEFPDLPKWETYTYATILFVMLAYGWYAVKKASDEFRDVLFAQHPRFVYENTTFFGPQIRDNSDYEWPEWKIVAFGLVPAMAIHSVLFNQLERVFSEPIKMNIMLVYSVAACFYAFDWSSTCISIATGFVLFATAAATRSSKAIWAVACPALYFTVEGSIKYHSHPYLILLLCMYNMCCWISYCVEMVNDNVRQEDKTMWQRLVRMFQYAFYLPYQISLIVPYPEWERQITERRTRKYDYKHAALYAIRTGFWYYVCDRMTYWFYMNAMAKVTYVMATVPLDQLCGIGYAIGAYFHLKYIVIFGVPSVFAIFDNMQPYEPPTCISRVSLYSKMWRAFDRGLYQFFKRYIFLPICMPTFSLPRRMCAMLAVFGFVTLWHGFAHHNLVWIALNIAELVQEVLAKQLYTRTPLKRWREQYIGDRIFRRFLAWLHVCPFVFALVSIFYFLGGSNAGWSYVERVLIGELLPLSNKAIFLLCFGYVYCNVCIDVENWWTKRQAAKKMKSE